MQISFLAASDGTALTKRFTLEHEQIVKHSYPNVSNFNSTTYDIQSLQELFTRTVEHAGQGACLLKGYINKPLVAESRAGSTTSTDGTAWILLDLDNVTGFDSIESFISTALPAEFQNASYIVHHSSSQGILPVSGLNCHLTFFLTKEIPAPSLKIFLETLNYNNDTLRAQLKLTASGTTLRYALDITTCQNDKLIFIADPILGEGVTCTLTHPRIQHVEKSTTFVQLSTTAYNPEQLRQVKDGIIATLRQDTGLKAKTISYKTENNVQFIANPDQATITGVRKARGFVYLNLEGGDSWAYYFPEDNARFLYSFKEPNIAYKLEDIAPEYASHYAREAESTKTAVTGRQPLVFRDMLTDTYWNGFFYTGTDTHEIHKASSKERLQDFMKDKGYKAPKIIPDWEIHFDPTTTETIDFPAKRINLFVPTTHMRLPPDAKKQIPEITHRILFHVVGNDVESFDMLINWIACKFQTREKLMTAWILTGIEGTGKGLLFHDILVPLFGAPYCQQKSLDNLEDTFNAWEEHTLIMNFNEARIGDSPKVSKLMNKLKNMVTEPITSIRGMRANLREAQSFLDVIITSNNNDAINITETDRRFNVAPRQNTKLVITENEVAQLRAETSHFAQFLNAYNANFNTARSVMDNEAKATMQLATRNSIEQILGAIHTNDLNYFAGYLTAEQSVTTDMNYAAYAAIVRRWISTVGSTCKIPRSELMTVYAYLQASNFIGPNKFTRLLSLHDVPLKTFRIGSQLEKGVEVDWVCDTELVDLWKETPGIRVVT